MGGRSSRVEGVAAVQRVDGTSGGNLWAELVAAPRAEPRVVVRVLPATLRALYAPSEAEAAGWPQLPDGVVTELATRR